MKTQTQEERRLENAAGSGRNMPEKKLRAGAVSVTIWLNQGVGKDGQATNYRTVSLERNYMDKSGAWQSTNSFRVNDLPKAAIALQRAYEHLVLTEQKLFTESAY